MVGHILERPSRTSLECHLYDFARDMACNKANGNRGLSQFAEGAFLSDSNALFVNYHLQRVHTRNTHAKWSCTIIEPDDRIPQKRRQFHFVCTLRLRDRASPVRLEREADFVKSLNSKDESTF